MASRGGDSPRPPRESRTPRETQSSRPPRETPSSRPPREAKPFVKHNTKEFENFLRDRLKRIVGSDVLEEFLSPESLKIWSQAFTDQTYSPDNYELLETIGDKAIDLAFYDIIKEALPAITQPKMYATLREFYVSEAHFSKLAIDAGFLDYLRANYTVRSSMEIMNKIAEDLWESYHGALFELGNTIGEKVYDIGIGYACVKNSMILIINDLTIDPERAAGAFKNQLNEITSALGIRLGTVNILKDGQVIFYYFIKKNNLEQLLKQLERPEEEIKNFINDKTSREIIRRIPAHERRRGGTELGEDDIIVGFESANNRDEAQDKAARQAIRTFRQTYQITDYELDRARVERLDAHMEGKGEVSEAFEIIRAEYPITRITVRPFGNSVLYMLLGVDKGKTFLIDSIKARKTDAYQDVQSRLYLKGMRNLTKAT